MKNPLPFCLVAFLVAGVVNAGPIDAAIVAAMKPSEQPNYSWTSSVVRDGRSYTVEGQTLVGSYTQVIVPANLALPPGAGMRGRMARGSSDSDTLAIFKGDEKYVLDTPDGWMTPEEFAKWSAFSGTPANPYMGRRRGGRGGFGLTTDLPLTFAISMPHEDVGIIISSYASIAIDGGIVVGRLTDTGAKLLLLPPGQANVTPEQASGAFRLWITDGMLTKYEIQVTGVVSVISGKDRREVKTTQTVSTELKNIGTTKLDVPAEAKKKLDS
jgi:hypothetical protein